MCSEAEVEPISEGEEAWKDFKQSFVAKEPKDNAQDDDDDVDEEDKPLALLVQQVKAMRSSSSSLPPAPPPSAPSVPSSLPPAPPPSAPSVPITRAVGAVAPAGSRTVMYDGIQFSELHSRGKMTGISRTCRYCGCSRDLSFGKKNPMTPAEARRRLLAWEAAGVGKSEEEHIDLGRSPLLAAFA